MRRPTVAAAKGLRLILATSFLVALAGAQTEVCSDGTTVGYTSLAALVNDENEADATATGNEPRGYVLCPGTTFESIWSPVSSGSIVLLCGTNGDPDNDCRLPGVDLSSPDLTHLSLVGLTFDGFTQAAISGSMALNGTVQVRDAIFQVSSVRLVSRMN